MVEFINPIERKLQMKSLPFMTRTSCLWGAKYNLINYFIFEKKGDPLVIVRHFVELPAKRLSNDLHMINRFETDYFEISAHM